MRIQIACLLLGLLCAIDVTEALTFEETHIYKHMTINKCNRKMVQINNDFGKCKKTNTFIKAKPVRVNAICEQGDGDKQSATRFNIVVCTCTFNGCHNNPHCIYEGKTAKRQITVKCENGRPVHYIK